MQDRFLYNGQSRWQVLKKCHSVYTAVAHFSEELEVNVSVHQGSALSPLLLAIVIDVVMSEIKEGTLQEILYVDELCMCICMWMYVYVCIDVCMHVHVYVLMYLYVDGLVLKTETMAQLQ